MVKIDMEKVYKHFMKQSKQRFRKRVLIEMSQKYTLECTRKATNSRVVVFGPSRDIYVEEPSRAKLLSPQ